MSSLLHSSIPYHETNTMKRRGSSRGWTSACLHHARNESVRASYSAADYASRTGTTCKCTLLARVRINSTCEATCSVPSPIHRTCIGPAHDLGILMCRQAECSSAQSCLRLTSTRHPSFPLLAIHNSILSPHEHFSPPHPPLKPSIN